MVDAAFDQAYNETVVAGDLPHIKWGRIDYMSVTYLTTKWSIWTYVPFIASITYICLPADSSGPYLVHIMDRGQTLRFYRADRVRVTADVIRELLTEDIWRNTQPWKSAFAPGGKRYVPLGP